MSRNTRDEYLEKMRSRYGRYTGKRAKSRLLDEFCQVTVHERKYATKLLSGQRGLTCAERANTSQGGRPRTYDAETRQVVHEICASVWMLSSSMTLLSSKGLNPVILTLLVYT